MTVSFLEQFGHRPLTEDALDKHNAESDLYRELYGQRRIPSSLLSREAEAMQAEQFDASRSMRHEGALKSERDRDAEIMWRRHLELDEHERALVDSTPRVPRRIHRQRSNFWRVLHNLWRWLMSERP